MEKVSSVARGLAQRLTPGGQEGFSMWLLAAQLYILKQPVKSSPSGHRGLCLLWCPDELGSLSFGVGACTARGGGG